MQAYANDTICGIFVALFFLCIGCAGTMLTFPGKKHELRAFLLSYTICLFIGGLAQIYSLTFFDDIQSTTDAHTFFNHIAPRPPFTTMAGIQKSLNAPLAVVIWQQVYKFAWFLGIDFGPYIAVMFNALLMGLSGSITVRTARELFGNDPWRLRWVGSLFSLCGLCILFGSILLRDCFTTFLNAVVIWWIVRWISFPKTLNFLIAVAVTSVSVYAMAYLRFEAIILFVVYWFLAIFFRFFKDGFKIGRFLTLYITISFSLFFASSYYLIYYRYISSIQTETSERYAGIGSLGYQSQSLGMRFVVNQPIPVRMLLGSGYLMIFPIPIWGYLKIGLNDYHLIKGYHALYQLFILPLVFSGFFLTLKRIIKNFRETIPFIFLGAYLIINLLAVVVTSLEQRHFGQFMCEGAQCCTSRQIRPPIFGHVQDCQKPLMGIQAGTSLYETGFPSTGCHR